MQGSEPMTRERERGLDTSVPPLLHQGLLVLALTLALLARHVHEPAIVTSAAPVVCEQFDKAYDTAFNFSVGYTPVTPTQVRDIVALLDLKAGATLADVGCGGGRYAAALGPTVGSGGRIFLVDVEPELVDIAVRRCKHEGIDNVVGIVSDQVDPKLPAGQVDAMLFIQVVHCFAGRPFEPFKRTLYSNLRRAMAPRGRLLVEDFDEAAPRGEVIAEFERSGFKLVENVSHDHSTYRLVFTPAPQVGAR